MHLDATHLIMHSIRLLDNERQNEVAAPYCSLSDHTLPITDICVGLGRFPSIRVLTASLDHTVKVPRLRLQSLA
jgi:pre-rRNA-processing protein IPI3